MDGHVLPLTATHALHLRAGWALIAAGLASGALLGTGFHRSDFLGGYGSLRRRLLRLGHIALVALGSLNVLFALTPCAAPGAPAERIATATLLVGALAMPSACAFVAWRPALRPLFALPVLALLTAVTSILVHLP